MSVDKKRRFKLGDWVRWKYSMEKAYSKWTGRFGRVSRVGGKLRVYWFDPDERKFTSFCREGTFKREGKNFEQVCDLELVCNGINPQKIYRKGYFAAGCTSVYPYWF